MVDTQPICLRPVFTPFFFKKKEEKCDKNKIIFIEKEKKMDQM